MSSQQWRQYGGKKNLPQTNSLSTHSVVTDKLLLRDAYEGNFNIIGSMNVSNDIAIGRNMDVSGNLTTKNLFVTDLTIFNNRVDILGNLFVDEKYITRGNIVTIDTLTFDNTDQYLYSYGNSLGLNTKTPQYTLDICSNQVQGFSVYSNQSVNQNILAQNAQHYGIQVSTTNNNSSKTVLYNQLVTMLK